MDDMLPVFKNPLVAPESAAPPEGEARARFRAFPPALRAALRSAAARNGWDGPTWPMQVAMVAEALDEGRCTAGELAAAYGTPVALEREGVAS